LKIGLIIPNPAIAGGVRRAVESITRFLIIGAELNGETTKIVLGVNGDSEKFSDIRDRHPHQIQLRDLTFEQLTEDDSARVLKAHGMGLPKGGIGGDWAMIRDDVCDMLDCDVWILISTRVISGDSILPLVPLRPVMLFPFDFLESYGLTKMAPSQVEGSARSARAASVVAVSTEQTRLDAIAYIGCKEDQILKTPIEFHTDFHTCGTLQSDPPSPESRNYCLWVTNGAADHKNHSRTLEALDNAANAIPGFRCIVIGHSMTQIPGESLQMRDSREYLLRRGFISDGEYCNLLAGARFVIHSATHDNGSYVPIEAAMHGVGTACADYPPMREIAESIGLTCEWFDPKSAKDIHRALIASWANPAADQDQQNRLLGLSLSDISQVWYSTVQPRLASLVSKR
jgi:hypothetical protein